MSGAIEDRQYQIIGMLGFIIAVLVFIAAGINLGDTLAIVGSVIWLIWMIPVLKPKGQ